ncbi:MAG: SDR family oxidoreductase [Gammaproteobacteria bacterium]
MREAVDNKSILITGCSSGIGLCTAQALHERGYRVFASARKREDVQRLRERGLQSLHLDLTDSNSIQNAVKSVLQETGGTLYALFNNGAYGQPGAVEDLRRDVMRAQFETNFLGWLELTNSVLPVMREQGYGRIIQNSSILGLVAMPYRGAYNASKFAIEGLSDTLRLELKLTSRNIHVVLIEPGPILTKFRDNSLLTLRENIDIDHSFHREYYQATIDRLSKEGPAVPFTLPPEAVMRRVIQALESTRPKARYYVTFPTHLFGFLRRILPNRLMVNLARRF